MSRSKQIQGLRAIAVALVLLFHTNWLPGGYIGVDVFYVISGFLITRLILQDEAFSFASFYARRAKRLLPASFLVLLLTSLLFWFLAPVISRAQYSKDLLASTWYLSNYLYAHWQNDYQNLGATPSPLIHFWSLAVEEQFYLFWPLILLAFRKRIKAAVMTVTILSFLSSLLFIQYSPIFAFYSLPTRAFELGLGALLFLFFDSSIISRVPAWIGLFTVFISGFIFDSHTSFPGFPALLPIFGAAAIIASERPIRLLEIGLIQRIGDWSYSIYLWHWPILILPTLYFQRELKVHEKFACLALTVLLAALTYKYIENPLRKSSFTNLRIGLSSIVAGVALSGCAVVLNLNSASALDIESIRTQPQIYLDGCQLDKKATKPKSSCVYGDTSAKKSLVLYGDSHAAQWFPAIDIWAKKNRYQLIVMTKSSCPALALPLKDNGAFKASACEQFRRNALQEIKRINPALVIVGNFEHYDGISVDSYAIVNFSFKYLLIRDTPWPNRDIPSCLTTKQKCDTDRPLTIPYSSSHIFDPIPSLCDSKKCPAMVDGLVAYRDQTHITVAMAKHLAGQLGQKIDALVAG